MHGNQKVEDFQLLAGLFKIPTNRIVLAQEVSNLCNYQGAIRMAPDSPRNVSDPDSPQKRFSTETARIGETVWLPIQILAEMNQNHRETPIIWVIIIPSTKTRNVPLLNHFARYLFGTNSGDSYEKRNRFSQPNAP